MRKRIIDVAIVVIPVAALLFWINYSQRLLTGATVPHEGEQIAFLRQDSGHPGLNIYMLDVASGETTQINRQERTSVPKWSPDGTFLSFLELPTTLYVLNPTSGEHCVISDIVHDYAWFPDSQQIAWVSTYGVADEQAGLYVSDWCGESQTRIDSTPELYAPTISPDGAQIAYMKWYEGDLTNRDVAIINVDGTEEIRIEREGSQSQPMWSPTGDTIAFRDNTADGNGVITAQTIMLYDTNTTDVSPLVDVFLFQPAHWSPTGLQLLYIEPEESRVCILTLETGEVQCTAQGTFAHWHPDGIRITYAGRDETALCTITVVSEENCIIEWDGRILPIGWRP